MFLCLPIVFGVNTKCVPTASLALVTQPRSRALADPTLAARRLKQEGDEVRPCQNCHNQSCVRVKRSKRFELFWVPL